MEPVRIPRRATWSFFEDLAEAASSMAHGHDPLDPMSLQRGNWQTVIHRDVKPVNIFFGLPRTPGKRGIPELKVGDFGLAVPHNYKENPEQIVGVGTATYRAPEQSANALNHRPVHKLSSATDVWAVGRITLLLVELSSPRPGEVFYGKTYQGKVQHAPEKEQRLKLYGGKLYELIENCLEPVPDDRTTASLLLKSIREYLDDDREGPPPRLEEDDSLQYTADLVWS